MGAEQLTLLEPVDEKLVRKTVISELKRYRALKVKFQNRKEQEEAGVVDLFPVLRKEEKLAELKVIQIERALEHSLDEIEREIIQIKYLESKQTKDINIYMDLGLKKEKYYEKKGAAILNIATSLGII
ncbi:ArpU family phage packaging/lysis transcriptional regulator [Priestia megaterium]|uniref:ArpU family phage packaging/lysis transcriptional regulator n=1 Tax=Priestia megaterium TaxID=1404 RepID=UPI002E1CD48E|nr:ArpU family phage packaging/lysis transcriptional regulator [Priestia megaterium]MED4240625.1 ArpU family phage packaging/lysis transcriptional regulator [Priestia megaterium]